MFCIHLSQGYHGGSLHAKVREPLALFHKIVGDIPEALSPGKLTDK